MSYNITRHPWAQAPTNDANRIPARRWAPNAAPRILEAKKAVTRQLSEGGGDGTVANPHRAQMSSNSSFWSFLSH